MKRRDFARKCSAAAMAAFCVGAWGQASLLQPSEAFQIRRAFQHGQWVEVEIWAAPGYAMYAERLRFETDKANVSIETVEIPKGERKFDEALGESLTYLRGLVKVRVKLAGRAASVKLTVKAQGCADAGICYPPVARTFEVGGLS